MATTNERRLELGVADLATLNAKQMGYLTGNDADMAFPAWGGKDGDGDITVWLAKSQNGLLLDLSLTDANHSGTTCSRLIHAADTDTYIQFQTDQQKRFCGAIEFDRLTEDTNDYYSIDPAGTGIKVAIGHDAPTVMLHAESATSTAMLLKNTGNAYALLTFDANRTAVNWSIGYITYKWNGTVVAAIDSSTGEDTTNKDDGYLQFYTATGGSLTQKMRLGYQLPIVEIGNPTTEDDATKWDATYHEGVLRIGINGALTSSNITTDFNTQLLHNAYCTAAGSTDDGTFKYRKASAAAFVIDMSVADGFSFCAADPGSADAAITWRKFFDYTPGVVSHNSDSGDIDFKWYGDNRQVAQLDAGTDSFQFLDYAGVAAQWNATASPTHGALIIYDNKGLYFGTDADSGMLFNGTYMLIQGNLLPDDAHKVTNYLYRDNGGYVKVA